MTNLEIWNELFCILFYEFLMYSMVFIYYVFLCFLICYVSEVYLDNFQDKHDQAKGLEDSIDSVKEQFKKIRIPSTCMQNVTFRPILARHAIT